MNFSPSAGREIADRHYALVLSADEYNRRSGMAIVCGITSRVRGWPFEVELPAGILPPKAGQAITSVVVADGVQQVDFREREAQFAVKAPPEILEEVLEKISAILD